jgi:hypothetical protein
VSNHYSYLPLTKERRKRKKGRKKERGREGGKREKKKKLVLLFCPSSYSLQHHCIPSIGFTASLGMQNRSHFGGAGLQAGPGLLSCHVLPQSLHLACSLCKQWLKKSI